MTNYPTLAARVRHVLKQQQCYNHIPYLTPEVIESCGTINPVDFTEPNESKEPLFSLFIEETLSLKTPRPSFSFFDIKTI